MLPEQDWIGITRILTHPKYSAAENLNTMYDVAMMQMKIRIMEHSPDDEDTPFDPFDNFPDIIRPICLPKPGQIQRGVLVNNFWYNYRFLKATTTRIISHDNCVNYRGQALKNSFGVTVKRFHF